MRTPSSIPRIRTRSNFALTVSEVPLNTAGPEAMDFLPGGYYLSHAIGWLKPWDGKHIPQALRGQPPRLAAKAYYQFANAPIKVWGTPISRGGGSN